MLYSMVNIARLSNTPNCFTGQITWMLVKELRWCAQWSVYVSAHVLIIAIHSDSQAQAFKRLNRKKCHRIYSTHSSCCELLYLWKQPMLVLKWMFNTSAETCWLHYITDFTNLVTNAVFVCVFICVFKDVRSTGRWSNSLGIQSAWLHQSITNPRGCGCSLYLTITWRSTTGFYKP